MTPHRIGKTGSFRFDRVFAGVGRINKSSGTTTLKEFRRRDLLLTELFEAAQLDVLRAFRRGDVSIEELLDAKRRKKLRADELLTDISQRENLWTALADQFPVVDRSRKTQQRYRVSLEAFERRVRPILGASARVSDLERVDWEELSRVWGRSGSDWNHMRRMLSRGLSRMLGKHSDVRRGILDEIPVMAEESRTPDLTPELFWRIVGAAPKHVQPAYVALIATGMRVGEYLACTPDHLQPFTFAINVPGTKTKGSRAPVYVEEELWPWIVAAVPSPVRYKWLHDYWQRACVAAGAGRLVGTGRYRDRAKRSDGPGKRRTGELERVEITRYSGLRIHDLRHAYAQLASDAGESTARIQAALRHASPEMTRRYEMQKARKDVAAAVGKAILKRA